jgi:hypothetical protein
MTFRRAAKLAKSTTTNLLNCHRANCRHHTEMRLSGLQKEVLALYRRCLRESRAKPAVIPVELSL